jgi:hypothetical protein
MEPKNQNPSPEDIFTWKMNNSDEYQKKFLTDFEFAKGELDQAGIKIDQQSYSEFAAALENVGKLAQKVFPVPGKWPKPVVIYLPKMPKDFEQ